MANKRWWIVLLLLVVAAGVLLSLRGGDGDAAPAPAAEAKPASAGTPAGREAEAKVAPEDPGRSAPPVPVKERSPKEIRESLEAKAREIMEKDLGGVTDEDKQALMAAIREFEALRRGGLSDQHPNMLLSLASFSRKIDRLSAYDEVEWKADAVAFLKQRLSEVEALGDGEPVAALRERWRREQVRDDLPEALLLRVVRPFGPMSTKKEGLRDELKKWIQTFEGSAK